VARALSRWTTITSNNDTTRRRSSHQWRGGALAAERWADAAARFERCGELASAADAHARAGELHREVVGAGREDDDVVVVAHQEWESSEPISTSWSPSFFFLLFLCFVVVVVCVCAAPRGPSRVDRSRVTSQSHHRNTVATRDDVLLFVVVALTVVVSLSSCCCPPRAHAEAPIARRRVVCVCFVTRAPAVLLAEARARHDEDPPKKKSVRPSVRTYVGASALVGAPPHHTARRRSRRTRMMPAASSTAARRGRRSRPRPPPAASRSGDHPPPRSNGECAVCVCAFGGLLYYDRSVSSSSL
jgi:hypothetical protein